MAKHDFFKISDLAKELREGYPFRRKMHHIKTTLLITKISGEYLKPFLLRIRANFYGVRLEIKNLNILIENWLFKENSFINANQPE